MYSTPLHSAPLDSVSCRLLRDRTERARRGRGSGVGRGSCKRTRRRRRRPGLFEGREGGRDAGVIPLLLLLPKYTELYRATLDGGPRLHCVSICHYERIGLFGSHPEMLPALSPKRGHLGKAASRSYRRRQTFRAMKRADAAPATREEGRPPNSAVCSLLFVAARARPLSLSVGLNDSGGKYVSRPLCDHHCHEVTAAEGRGEGRGGLVDSPPHLLVLAVRLTMGSMNGLEVVHQPRKMPPRHNHDVTKRIGQ